MALATKEVLNNEDEIDQILEDVKEGKKTVVLFNWKVFKACIIIIIQLEIITFFAAFSVYDNPFYVVIDWAFFLKSQQVEIIPVIIAGMSAGSNIKIKKMRDKLAEDNRQLIANKDQEIKDQNRQILALNTTIYQQKEELFKLKIRLDDLAATKAATEEAVKRAEENQ
jgi:hypothetical protein